MPEGDLPTNFMSSFNLASLNPLKPEKALFIDLPNDPNFNPIFCPTFCRNVCPPNCAALALNSPALVANYLYDLVKLFNSFYQNVSVFGETQESLQSMRLLLCESVGKNIAAACGLLGISLPDSM